jgi:hypothetical protein
MSAVGSGELAEVLLRSSTPGASQSVPQCGADPPTTPQLQMRKVSLPFNITEGFHLLTHIPVLNFLQSLPSDNGAMSPHSRPPSEIASQFSISRPAKNWNPSSPKITGTPNIYAPSPKNGSVNHGLDDLANSRVSYGGAANGEKEHDDDLDSNVQDGVRSELGGETVPIHTTGMVSL